MLKWNFGKNLSSLYTWNNPDFYEDTPWLQFLRKYYREKGSVTNPEGQMALHCFKVLITDLSNLGFILLFS